MSIFKRKIYTMKTALLIIVSIFSSNILLAQNEVYLNINHKLGAEDALSTSSGTNNLGNDFTVNRMQYYLSNFKLIHDNGQETPIVDLYALVNGQENTEIALGSLTFTEIEGIKFSVGVDGAKNHLDPTSYNSSHPLAPQNPSMHWGWASGYRFVAMEGTGGPSNQVFEIHALGDNLYFEANIVVGAVTENGNVYINIDGDYAEAIRDIDVSSGLIQHGSSAEAADLLLNFQTNVFKASPMDTAITNPTAINNRRSLSSVSIYPNPSNGVIQISLENNTEITSIELYNATGSLIKKEAFNDEELSIYQAVPGLYFAVLKDQQGQILGRTKLIIE